MRKTNVSGVYPHGLPTESKTGTKKDEMTSKGGFAEDRLEIRESKRVRDR
jgi:hypothetical protein